MRHQHMTESDLVKICEKCKRPHESLPRHEFFGHKHYVCFTCGHCGEDMCIMSDHLNSGHESPNSVLMRDRPDAMKDERI
ncbi:MAG: hypothetical protein ABIE94_02585 [archaeon]